MIRSINKENGKSCTDIEGNEGKRNSTLSDGPYYCYPSDNTNIENTRKTIRDKKRKSIFDCEEDRLVIFES